MSHIDGLADALAKAGSGWLALTFALGQEHRVEQGKRRLENEWQAMIDAALSGGPIVSKPKNVTAIPDPLLERMAKAGYEEVVKRTEHLRDPGGRTWETETEALREDWRAIARAILQSSAKEEASSWRRPPATGKACADLSCLS